MVMDRFQNNKRVFVVLVEDAEFEDGIFSPGEDINEFILEFALEYTADLFMANAKKLEKELIGMASVKEQVHNIVAVMKYNKYREKWGLKRHVSIMHIF
jgi:hypothetical protein